jgi:hypothetical protein
MPLNTVGYSKNVSQCRGLRAKSKLVPQLARKKEASAGLRKK